MKRMEEVEESSSEEEEEESEDEEDEGSTTSSSEEEDDFDWLRGKMSGLFGSRTHFGSAHSRQVEIFVPSSFSITRCRWTVRTSTPM